MKMQKQSKAYQVRTFAYEGAFSKTAGRKLYSRQRALKIVKRLKSKGIDAIAAVMLISSSAKIAN
jgi:adenine/guanine phosphoribosyltransferase-like PRPP-binding protein